MQYIYRKIKHVDRLQVTSTILPANFMLLRNKNDSERVRTFRVVVRGKLFFEMSEMTISDPFRFLLMHQKYLYTKVQGNKIHI